MMATQGCEKGALPFNTDVLVSLEHENLQSSQPQPLQNGSVIYM